MPLLAVGLAGCDAAEIAGPIEEVVVDDPLWEVGPTDSASVRSALTTCLAIVRDEEQAAALLAEGGWTVRPFPNFVDDTLGKTVYENGGQSELIAVGPSQTYGTVCSVLSSASHTMLVEVVDDFESGFAGTMDLMPHGPMWSANGVIIDNDYANQHVFQPEVFNPELFHHSEISDIRIYRCREHC